MQHSNIAAARAIPALAKFSAEPGAIEAAAVYLARHIVSRRSTVPVLACLHISASPDGLVTLTATNLEQSASVTVPARVDDPGQFCTDASLFADTLVKARKSKASEIRIDDDGYRVKVAGGAARYQLSRMPGDEFPLAFKDRATAATESRRRTLINARAILSRTRQDRTAQRQRADMLHARLIKLRAEMADPGQPERASDIARLVRERDEARTALSAVSARNLVQDRAIAELADRFEAMVARVGRAETALRKVAA